MIKPSLSCGNGKTLTLCKIALKAEKEGRKVMLLPSEPAMTEQGLMGAYPTLAMRERMYRTWTKHPEHDNNKRNLMV